MGVDSRTERVIGCAIEVHRALGAGLLESVYQQCLAHEFGLQDIDYERELPMPVRYKGIDIDTDYRLDFWVEEQLVLELKAVREIREIDRAQILTYMKLSGCSTGLLINFHVTKLVNGIQRFKL